MLLKRSGRGHDPEGVEGTKPGQCAVECPVCPHPGRNVPLDWNKAPESLRCDFPTYLTSGIDFHQMEVPSDLSCRCEFPNEEQGAKY
jgi:hypothetical protein